MLKKILSLFLTLCMALGLSSVAFAVDDSYKTIEYIAQNWIDAQFSGNAEVENTISLRSVSTGETIGYMISFKSNDSPAGYIVLSCEERGQPIIEFSLEGQCVYHYLEQQYDEIKTTVSANMSISNLNNAFSAKAVVEDNVLYTDFISYSIRVHSDTQSMLFDQFLQFTPYSESNLMKSSTTQDDPFFTDYKTIPTEEGTKTVRNITGANEIRALCMEDMPNASSQEGNCGPTALANTAKLYAEFALNGNRGALSDLKVNDSDDDTYERLVAISGYSSSTPATMTTLVSSMRSFAIERGYSCTITDYSSDYWSDFTRDIAANKPILLYTANSEKGHAQVVVGYWEYDMGEKYVKILSGWTTYPTFVKYKPSSLTRFNGYCVSISY